MCCRRREAPAYGHARATGPCRRVWQDRSCSYRLRRSSTGFSSRIFCSRKPGCPVNRDALELCRKLPVPELVWSMQEMTRSVVGNSNPPRSPYANDNQARTACCPMRTVCPAFRERLCALGTQERRMPARLSLSLYVRLVRRKEGRDAIRVFCPSIE